MSQTPTAVPAASKMPPARPAAAWVPIRSLSPQHRPRITRHLLALSSEDRYLRFGYAANDEQIQRYTQGLNFERDLVFGIYNRRLTLVAMAHLACPDADEAGSGLAAKSAEFGVSVSASARGRGYGARLFDHAMLHARNRGLDTLLIHALSENTTMLHIARKAGGVVRRTGTESDAYVMLPPDTLASRVEQWVGEGAAQLDYGLKKQARAMHRWLGALRRTGN